MGREIAAKIEANKGKFALTREEKAAGREEVKRLASVHAAAAIKKLGDLISDKTVPASAKVAAASQLLDRVAGKPVKEDPETNPEREIDRMSQAQVLSWICTQIAGLSLEARGAIAEALLCAQRGIAFDPRTIDPDFSESAASRAEDESAGLPPLERKPKKEPRR